MDWDPSHRFYPIIDSELCRARGLNPGAVAAACLAAGAGVLQLRAKRESSAAFLSLADQVVVLARGRGRVLVNDRADIALLAGADGVHVGQEDLPADAVRRLYATATIGLSTHDEPQVDAALRSSADYVAVGPVFGTSTKDTGYRACGLALVRYAAGRGKPIVAIGGITLERAAEVLGAGAAAVAVIADVLAGSAIEERVREYLRL